MTAADRARLTRTADALCLSAFTEVFGTSGDQTPKGVALAAVGGYGRGELAPYSDLDVVLMHDDDVELSADAGALWYPLWDSGRRIDHSVRALGELTTAARDDARVALGLLDLRPLAGDRELVRRARGTILTHWRHQARHSLRDIAELNAARHERFGELAHGAVPDLKESMGGLRDATVLKALVASWLVDVPHTQVETTRARLLDVRDIVQRTAGRGSDRLTPEVWPALAQGLGLRDAEAAQRQVRELGRRMTHLSRLTWRRAEAVLAKPVNLGGGPRRPDLRPIAPGLALSGGEVVLDRGAAPSRDPLLLLRAAAHAAERGLALSPVSVARLIRESPELPVPWPRAARDLMVRLLGCGPGLLEVWETLEETGAIERLMPEWESIRLLPHASVIHRFTVDRHVVETCCEAARLIRQTPRPDLLLVAALLHDIGKSEVGDHSAVGAPIARDIALRWGFDSADADIIETLVRHHLLLVTLATTRDPDDPATVRTLSTHIGEAQVLELLALLTQADALATSPQAWSTWRAGLVGRLVTAAQASLRGAAPPARVAVLGPIQIPPAAGLTVSADGEDRLITVGQPDRMGLLADIAGLLALSSLPVRSVRAETVQFETGHATTQSWGRSQWRVGGRDINEPVLRQRFTAMGEGRLDPASRLTVSGGFAAEVRCEPAPPGSRVAIIEVRGPDRPGLLFAVLRSLTQAGLSVTFAQIDTIGGHVVDVFYVQDAQGEALADEHLVHGVEEVRRALRGSGQASN